MKIKLSRLQKVANPFEADAGSLPFDDIDNPISISDVHKAIAQGNIFESPDVDVRENHIRHIAYLVCNYEPQTIVLNTDLAIENKWWVTHNTEVLAAAIIRQEENIEVLASGDEKLLEQLLGIEEGFMVNEKDVFVLTPEWQAFDWSANLNQDMNDFNVILEKMQGYDSESSEAVEMLDYIKPHMLADAKNVKNLVDFMFDALKYMKEEQLNTEGVVAYVRENPALIVHIASNSIWKIKNLVKDEKSIFGHLLKEEMFNNLEHCKTLFKLSTVATNLMEFFTDEIKKSDEFLTLYYEEHRQQNRYAGQLSPTLFSTTMPVDFFDDEKRVKEYLKFGLSKETQTVDHYREHLLFKNWIHNKDKVVEYLKYLNEPSDYKIIGRDNVMSEDKPVARVFSKLYHALPKELNKEPEIIEQILPHYGKLYDDLPINLRRRPDFMTTYLLSADCIEHSKLPKEVLFSLEDNEKNTQAIARLISTNPGFMLHDDIPQSWRDNIRFLMLNPEYLNKLKVSDEIWQQIYSNEMYCEKIIRNTPENYEHFPDNIKHNIKFAMIYLVNTNNPKTLKEHIPPGLWNNHEFCLRMLDAKNLNAQQKVNLINENFWDDKKFLLKFFKALDYVAVPYDVLEKAPEKIQVFLKSFDLNAGDYYQFFNRLFLTDKIKNQITHQPEDEDSPKMKI